MPHLARILVQGTFLLISGFLSPLAELVVSALADMKTGSCKCVRMDEILLLALGFVNPSM